MLSARFDSPQTPLRTQLLRFGPAAVKMPQILQSEYL